MSTPEQIAEANYRASLLADTIAGGGQGAVSPAVSMQARQAVAPVARQSPPIRYGQLYGANGVHSGTTYFEPVNQSASPVIGGYSPYATMLYAPPRRNRFLEMQAMFNAFRPDPAMMQQMFQQIIRQPVRMGGSGGTGKSNASNSAPNKTVEPPYKPPFSPVSPRLDPRLAGGPTRRVMPGRFSTFDDYGLNEELVAGVGGGGGGGGGVGAEIPTEKRAMTDPPEATTRDTVRGGQLKQVPIEPAAPTWWQRVLQWNLFPQQNLYEPNRKNGMPSTVK